MVRSLRIFVVRHGETTWNAEGRFQGRSNSPLSARGRAQALAVARRLQSEPVVAVYASPLERTVATARMIADPHGLEVTEIEDLAETDLGEWEGMTDDEIRAAGLGEQLDLYRADPVRFRPPRAETLEQVAGRVGRALDTMRESHPSGTIVTVGHGGSGRALFCEVMGVPAVPHMLAFRMDNGSISLIECGSHRSWIRFLNDTCHLADITGAVGSTP